MASYYVKYNDVNLTNLIGVRTVENTVLPPRENHAITIWERTGSIYNSYRYGERQIIVTFLIRASQSEYTNNPDCMESKLNTLRNVFRVSGPKPLYLGSSSRYINAVPEGDFEMSEIRYDCYECKVKFVCHDPEYYSASVKSANSYNGNMRRSLSNNKTIDVYNSGNTSAYPIINIGINNTASFVQVENIVNGKKFLIGNYPKSELSFTDSKETIILNDNMDNVSNWTTNSSYVDSRNDYRATNGTLQLTSDGSGFMINTAGTESFLWHGVSAQRKLDTPVTNFSVKAKMSLNSIGIGGDPTVPQLKDAYESVYSGTKDYYYKVVAPTATIKDSPHGMIIGSYNKGDYIFPTSAILDNGWVQTEDGYCDVSYLRKYVSDSTTTDIAINAVVTSEAELRSISNNDHNESILLATIPGGTIIRVYKAKENGYYKLYIAYNGKIGYIDSSKVTLYEHVAVDYPEDELIVTDDYKTGICEVYGYSATGTKLFKLCLCDDNKYYEYTKPTIDIGNNIALQDISAVPKSNKGINTDNVDITYDYLSENISVDWNNFYGELGVQRLNNK